MVVKAESERFFSHLPVGQVGHNSEGLLNQFLAVWIGKVSLFETSQDSELFHLPNGIFHHHSKSGDPLVEIPLVKREGCSFFFSLLSWFSFLGVDSMNQDLWGRRTPVGSSGSLLPFLFMDPLIS